MQKYVGEYCIMKKYIRQDIKSWCFYQTCVIINETERTTFMRKMLIVGTLLSLMRGTPALAAHHLNHHHIHPIPAIVKRVVIAPLRYLRGMASWYGGGDGFDGARTASGVPFDTYKPMCAMRYIKLKTWVTIKNIDNGLTTRCRIMDRGPYAGGRIIDLSYAVKRNLQMGGTALVEVVW
jgi:rare lipoprotein A